MKMKLITYTRKTTIENLNTLIKKGRYTFRADVADIKDLSLIATAAVEMIASSIDLPPALAIEDDNGYFHFIANYQTLYALTAFLNGNITLTESVIDDSVSNMKADELDLHLYERIVDKYFTVSSCLGKNLVEPEVEELVRRYNLL